MRKEINSPTRKIIHVSWVSFIKLSVFFIITLCQSQADYFTFTLTIRNSRLNWLVKLCTLCWTSEFFILLAHCIFDVPVINENLSCSLFRKKYFIYVENKCAFSNKKIKWIVQPRCMAELSTAGITKMWEYNFFWAVFAWSFWIFWIFCLESMLYEQRKRELNFWWEITNGNFFSNSDLNNPSY